MEGTELSALYGRFRAQCLIWKVQSSVPYVEGSELSTFHTREALRVKCSVARVL